MICFLLFIYYTFILTHAFRSVYLEYIPQHFSMSVSRMKTRCASSCQCYLLASSGKPLLPSPFLAWQKIFASVQESLINASLPLLQCRLNAVYVLVAEVSVTDNWHFQTNFLLQFETLLNVCLWHQPSDLPRKHLHKGCFVCSVLQHSPSSLFVDAVTLCPPSPASPRLPAQNFADRRFWELLYS